MADRREAGPTREMVLTAIGAAGDVGLAYHVLRKRYPKLGFGAMCDLATRSHESSSPIWIPPPRRHERAMAHGRLSKRTRKGNDR